MLMIFAVKFEKWIFGIFSLHDGRSFTFVQDDALPSLIILNGDKNTL